MSDFNTSKVVKARQPHSCEECGVDIQPGQTYRKDSGRFDGSMWSSKYCLSCGALVDWCWANDVFDHSSGHVPGDMLTELVEAQMVELVEDETEDHANVHLTPRGAQWLSVDVGRNYPFLLPVPEARP
ncbi:hypothetical protein [Deinococcus sp. Leaf326]|uniref:hypothetical protein n=1 Tax=Deinococcus sp. Leaf326 TaxID=1736338 RepID=UPI0006F836BD|nr:hypothetical protein [Deinococcus sp. Leaf326]KQR22891.1 hypothetical protein ASF71_06910 [Deinococcus sp. Leaf326]